MDPSDPRPLIPLPRVDLKVGFACNNRCLFCAQGEKRTDCGALSIGDLLHRLGATGERPAGLVLTGGEPTLHRDLLLLVAAARRMGYAPIQLQTNGRLLAYPRRLAALLAAGVDEISPSLHGSTAAIHEALTRAPRSFAESCQGIANAVAAGVPVITNSVVTRQNALDLPALVGLLARLRVRRAQLAFVHPVGTAWKRFDEVVPRLAEVVAPIAAARVVAHAAGIALVTEGVPLCFLGGMEDLAVEAEIPRTTVVDLDGRAADYSVWRVTEGKAHGPPCRECTARARCEGPWREIPERFGWGEFVALGKRDSPSTGF